MTEQEWLVSADPENMLRFLIPLTPRRGRLFSCACCRSMWHLLSDMGKTALKIAEQYADGQATLKDLLAFTLRGPRQYSQPTLDDVMTVNLHYYVAYNIDLNAVMGTVDAPYYNVDTSVFFVGTPSENVSEGPVSRPDWACANAIRETLFPQQDFAVYEFVGRAVLRACGDVPAMLRTQCGILRDIFGNPFRPGPTCDRPGLHFLQCTYVLAIGGKLSGFSLYCQDGLLLCGAKCYPALNQAPVPPCDIRSPMAHVHSPGSRPDHVRLA